MRNVRRIVVLFYFVQLYYTIHFELMVVENLSLAIQGFTQDWLPSQNTTQFLCLVFRISGKNSCSKSHLSLSSQPFETRDSAVVLNTTDLTNT